MSDPVLHLIAGPNGAGKSTFYEEVIAPVAGLPFIKAEAAQRRRSFIDDRRSFATETVFSHASKLELIALAQTGGYLVVLHIVAVPEALAVARVASRVATGGHDVPEEKIRSRHRRLWSLIAEALRQADEGYVYDNTKAAEPFRVVAHFVEGRLVTGARWPVWAPTELSSL